jgi:hypothetical protein
VTRNNNTYPDHSVILFRQDRVGAADLPYGLGCIPTDIFIMEDLEKTVRKLRGKGVVSDK